ncbi:hypothetical protein DSOUD_2641 [Desulfuromonas soudanensis]|uniref:Uncharacterized protein n=1 Tax=Desulfuromonas soudanensis TaxID=1603606 RepID=A0A0M3QG89_9BACT|nr:hypothetical protein [Desulfuromonas soudanensis]ALC17393.1 hypothetical protein DSOUD_2641 [Desulfuromonas soudanensis]
MDAAEKKEFEAMFRHHMGELAEKFGNKVDAAAENFKVHLGIFSKGFQQKLDIVVEGHQMLGDKIDRIDGRMEGLENRTGGMEVKLDAVVSDMAAHRKDGAAHGVVWRVKEDGE